MPKVKVAEIRPDATKKKWKLKYDGKEGSDPGTYPVIEAEEEEGPHLIVFSIKDGQGVTFSEKDPIWVHEGAASPTQPGLHDQIPAWRVRDSGKKLVVFDWNDQKVDLSYRLNFNGADPLDPIIKNGGGTTQPIVEPSPPTGTAQSASSEKAPAPGYSPPYSGGEILVAAIGLLIALLVGYLLGKR